MTLYTMVGLPASGKSTFAANHPECIVVCPDEIRARLYGDASIQGNGAQVFSIAFKHINQALAAGHDVIFDATNTKRRYRKAIFKNAPSAYHVAVYLKTPLEVCKERNAKRERVVPNEVIERMAVYLNPPTIEEGFKEIIELE